MSTSNTFGYVLRNEAELVIRSVYPFYFVNKDSQKLCSSSLNAQKKYHELCINIEHGQDVYITYFDGSLKYVSSSFRYENPRSVESFTVDQEVLYIRWFDSTRESNRPKTTFSSTNTIDSQYPSQQNEVESIYSEVIAKIEQLKIIANQNVTSHENRESQHNLSTLQDELNALKEENSKLKSRIQSLNDQENDVSSYSHPKQNLITELVSAYKAKHLLSQINDYRGLVINLKSISSILESVPQIDSLEHIDNLLTKLTPLQDPFKRVLQSSNSEDVIKVFIEDILQNDELGSDHEITLSDLQSRMVKIIKIIWEINLNEHEGIKQNLIEALDIVGLEIVMPTINTSFNFSEHRIVEKVKKSGNQPHKAIVSIVSPCVRVKGSGVILEKSAVIVAE